ncbi:hypothetical protein RvY_01864 [Ramazzottius varieornatus]|uniref:Uncharacterized protein n=1 Tax=Ramazzottius varieornatus TaxID=947166 RepID=A0A1D1USZ7_RAMVA|nr:hypothetical protein RvY_01864 [Ramazzottius varieornatus]
MLPPIYNTQKQDWVDLLNIPAPQTPSPTLSDYDAARFKRDFAEVVHHWDTENRKEDQRDKKTDMLIEIKKEPLEIENISP